MRRRADQPQPGRGDPARQQRRTAAEEHRTDPEDEVVQQPGVTSVIPGARSPEQARANAAAGELPPLGDDFLAAVADLYDRELREAVHPRW